MEQHLYRVTYILKEERIDENNMFSIVFSLFSNLCLFNYICSTRDGTDRIRYLVSAAKPEGDLNLKSKIIFN